MLCLVVFLSSPAVKYDLNDVRKHAKLNRLNNTATVCVFFTVLINIFITALGFEGYTIRSSSSPVISVPEPQLFPLPVDLNITGGI
ncbi:ninjurin-1-like protein [Lates japonicus]|uniref:Ninjurin-1-like protein n=1 Tax=Lates japonicus TaxID=270547 RepID=A0AAD3M1W0_LATJO|nr:ninjurin-1-like protein [Lates japonicus]